MRINSEILQMFIFLNAQFVETTVVFSVHYRIIGMRALFMVVKLPFVNIYFILVCNSICTYMAQTLA